MSTGIKPCEHCGEALPEGVDRHTRSIRSQHFEAHARERREAQAINRPALPEPMTEYEDCDCPAEAAYAQGWNACLESVKEAMGINP